MMMMMMMTMMINNKLYNITQLLNLNAMYMLNKVTIKRNHKHIYIVTIIDVLPLKKINR